MPVIVDPNGDSRREQDAYCLRVGLVNNMFAPEVTEKQFYTLLEAAAGDIDVRLSLFALPGVPRTPEGREHVRGYCSIDALLNTRLDGIIVTGTEPRAPMLSDEPYWKSLVTVLQWAEHNTSSSIWSCLAAHAAVQQLDGISRRRLGDKLFGVFDCAKVAATPLTDAMTAGYAWTLRVPHSRWNDLAADELGRCGYQFLTRSNDAGVDSFVKQRRSLFVFLQGHPEYDAGSLLREYRRDLRRFLRRESESCPAIPRGCLGEDDLGALAALQAMALTGRREDLIRDFPFGQMLSKARNTWYQTGVTLYRNWLQYVCTQRAAGRRRFIGTLSQPAYKHRAEEPRPVYR